MSQESFNTQDHTSNVNDAQDKNQYDHFDGSYYPAFSNNYIEIKHQTNENANGKETFSSKNEPEPNTNKVETTTENDDNKETIEESKISPEIMIINDFKAYYHITKISGKLYYYDYLDTYYSQIHNKQKMKELLYSYLKQKDISKVNPSFLNKCTELLMIESYPTSFPSENNGLIPFNDNVVDLNAIRDNNTMSSEFLRNR